MTEQTEVVTRTREARRRAAAIIRDVGEAKGPAQMWAIANLKMQGLVAEQMAASAEAVEALRDIILEIRASMPLYAVEQRAKS